MGDKNQRMKRNIIVGETIKPFKIILQIIKKIPLFKKMDEFRHMFNDINENEIPKIIENHQQKNICVKCLRSEHSVEICRRPINAETIEMNKK